MTTTSTTTDVLHWPHAGGAISLDLSGDAPVRLLSLATDKPADEAGRGRAPLVEVATDGDGHTGTSIHAEHRNYATSLRLRYRDHEVVADEHGRGLRVTQGDETTGLRVVSQLREAGNSGVVRGWTEVHNDGDRAVRLRYVSLLAVCGIADDPTRWRDIRVHVPYNGWATEFRWQRLTLEQAGIVAIGHAGGHSTRSRFAVTGHGSWSSGDYLPMGAVSDERSGRAWVWQIEHNGAWHWEVSDADPDVWVRISGPTEQEHQWTTMLEPGASFTGVPVAVAFSAAGFESALRSLTTYRRAVRRPNADNEKLPVIFNDYMNALMGDPTTEKLLPLIDAAAKAGAEYFVVDAGWYTDEPGWWDLVGDWQEAPRRFPGGFRKVADHIRDRGMVPGLWLEPEVVGVRSARATALPDEAFFLRDGHRVVEHERYQLDFRHPDVLAFLDATIDRLVADYGIGYFKFDHNINVGAGTDVGTDSPGEGLLGHNRALSAWLDGLFARHESLVIENCSSGGMRVDHAQLRRMSIQSTSDQQDPVQYAAIAAAAPSALAPEQAAIWAYPQGDMDPELLAFTMVNSLLGRIHLSGHLDRMDDDHLRQVREGVDAYKSIRVHIPTALPLWPLGLPGWYDDWLATALETNDGVLLSVWRRGGYDRARLSLPALADAEVEVEVIHPHPTHATPAPSATWDAASGTLEIHLTHVPTARLLRLRKV